MTKIDWDQSQRAFDKRAEAMRKKERQKHQQSTPKCASPGCNQRRNLATIYCTPCNRFMEGLAAEVELKDTQQALEDDFEGDLRILEARCLNDSNVDVNDVVFLLRKLWTVLEARRGEI